jgi:2-phosphoglycolate phosphatase
MRRTRRAVLFDLDGTILHTAPDLAGAINDMRIERGLAALPVEDLAPFCSFGGRGMLEKGLAMLPEHAEYPAAYNAFIEAYRVRMTRETAPYDGIRELMQALQAEQIGWGVVTNKAERLAVPLMDAMAFDPLPGCVIGGDTAGVAKPDPAPILLACERMGVDPTDCIYIGDSDRDIAAGRAAGMSTIGVAYGYVPVGDDANDWLADAIAVSVADLSPAIKRLQTQQA